MPAPSSVVTFPSNHSQQRLLAFVRTYMERAGPSANPRLTSFESACFQHICHAPLATQHPCRFLRLGCRVFGRVIILPTIIVSTLGTHTLICCIKKRLVNMEACEWSEKPHQSVQINLQVRLAIMTGRR